MDGFWGRVREREKVGGASILSASLRRLKSRRLGITCTASNMLSPQGSYINVPNTPPTAASTAVLYFSTSHLPCTKLRCATSTAGAGKRRYHASCSNKLAPKQHVVMRVIMDLIVVSQHSKGQLVAQHFLMPNYPPMET